MSDAAQQPMDPLKALVDGHGQVSEWLKLVEEAAKLPGKATEDVEQLTTFFRLNVRQHFLYEEVNIFPQVLEADSSPATATLIAELRDEHQIILKETGMMLQELAHAVLDQKSSSQVQARVQRVLESMKAHALKEDTHLLPLVESNRTAIANSSN